MDWDWPSSRQAICDYHGRSVDYGYNDGWHVFTVVMG